MTLGPFRIGNAALPHFESRSAEELEILRRQFVGCDTLFTYPKADTTVDSATPITFKWDTKCDTGATNVDILVYQPSSDKPLIGNFKDIPFSAGEYTSKVSPYYKEGGQMWTQVYIAIANSGAAVWEAGTIGQGPLFNVTYTPTVVTVSGVAFTQPPENTGATTFESVEDTTGKKSNKSVIAVAVVIPIVVVCILGAVAFYFYRIKEKKKLARWSQALSTHSQLDWEKGALPGERIPSSYGRPSSAYSRNGSGRPSTGYGRPSTAYGRPSTTYGRPSMSSVNRSSVMMDNMAGAGAHGGLRAFPGADGMDPNRSSVVMPDGYVRQSRISFADTARPRISSDNRARGSMLAPNTSADELRNLEAVAYANHHGDSNSMETLDPASAAHGRLPVPPPPAAPGSSNNDHSTVAYGPDQMLAVYAQRKGSTSPTPPAPAVTPTGSKVKRFLTRKGDRKTQLQQQATELRVTAPSPEPVQMVSYTHLNNGTASAAVIDNLPMPGPPRRESEQSGVSKYEDAREHV